MVEVIKAGKNYENTCDCKFDEYIIVDRDGNEIAANDPRYCYLVKCPICGKVFDIREAQEGYDD